MDIEEDKEIEEEMLLRESKIRFPEVEEWILKMAVQAHLKLEGKRFISDVKKGNELKKSYSQETTYTTI